MNTIYVIEECLAPGVWTLMHEYFYNSKEEASSELVKINNAMLKLKRSFNGRVTALHLVPEN